MVFINVIKLIFVIEQMRILMGDIIFILMKEREYIGYSVYKCERGGMYVNTPGVEARVEYPRHDVRNDVVVPHFFHLRTCD